MTPAGGEAKVISLHPDWQFVADAAANETSQFGEDGIIDALLKRFGETNRWCFEVGAHNGEYYSNTKRLRDAGWNAALIEADDGLFEGLRQFENAAVRCIHHRIIATDLDAVLDSAGCHEKPDVGIIDIDGDDYWAFKNLRRRPRILAVEFAEGGGEFCPIRPGGGQAQQRALTALAESKGYCPVVSTLVNLIMVDGCLLAKAPI